MLKRVLSTVALLAILVPAGSASGQWVISQRFRGCGDWACVTYEYLALPYFEFPNVFIDAYADWFFPNGELGGWIPGFELRMIPLFGNTLFSNYGPSPGITPDDRLPKRFPLTVYFGRWDVEWDGSNHNRTETFWLDEVNSVTAPEPATLLLLGTGLLGVAGAARRRRTRHHNHHDA